VVLKYASHVSKLSSNDVRKQAEVALDVLKRELSRLFADSTVSEDAIEHFGVYTIKGRVKTDDSLERKGLSLDRFSSLHQATSAKGYEDLIGLRVVVESQFHKIRVLRAINTIIRLGLNLSNVSQIESLHVAKNKGRWKFFNPPLNYLYSSPQFIRDVEHLSFLEAKRLAKPDEPEPKPPVEDEDMSQLKIEEILDNLQVDIVRDPSGYASVQRTILATLRTEHSPRQFQFELQIRTVLEDAWAEQSHKVSYKGSVPQHVKDLLRNLGSQLGSADDLMQMIYDTWQEHNSGYQVPFGVFHQNYDIKGNYFKLAPPSLRHVADDFRSVYQQRRFGRFGNALRIVHELCFQVAKELASFDERTENLSAGKRGKALDRRRKDEQKFLRELLEAARFERAITMCYFTERPRFPDIASAIFDELTKSDFPVIRFWAHYRKSYMVIRLVESSYLIGKEQTKLSIENIDAAMSSLDAARAIWSDSKHRIQIELATDCTEVEFDFQLWRAILHRNRYDVTHDIVHLQEALTICRALRTELLETQVQRPIATRRYRSLRRVTNSTMYYLLILADHQLTQGSSVKDLVEEALRVYGETVAWANRNLQTVRNYRDVLDQMTSKADRPRDFSRWLMAQLKDYDTLYHLLVLLHKNNMDFTVGGDVWFKAPELGERAQSLRDHLGGRMLWLTLRGDVMYDASLLRGYDIIK